MAIGHSTPAPTVRVGSSRIRIVVERFDDGCGTLDPDEKLIRLNSLIPRNHRLDVLVKLATREWLRQIPRPTTDDEFAKVMSLITTGVIVDLERMGGRQGLEALQEADRAL